MQQADAEYSGKDLARFALIVLATFVVWRGALLLFDFLGTSIAYGRWFLADGGHLYPRDYFANAWCQWDCAWYERIIEHGYYLRTHPQSDVAFFPLYPFLAKWLGAAIGSSRAAGLVIAHLSTLLGLWFVFLIGLRFFGEQKARRALVLMLLFPGSLFFSAFYSEGLYLLATAGGFYYFFRRRYLLCGLFGALAVLTRSSGILLPAVFGAVLLYEMVARKTPFTPRMLWLLLAPAALGLFMLVLYVSVSDPLAFLKAQVAWGRKLVFPLHTFVREFRALNLSFPKEASNTQRLIDAFAAATFLAVAGLMIYRRYHPALWLFVLGGVLLSLSTGLLMSSVRFTAVLFPAFYWFADVTEDRRVERAVVFCFTFFLALYSVMFMNGRWAG